ncbi:MAG TPA: VCBS repeat-containing protein [Bryobacteraceae bacterium]|nr:VCBS repeat-containing protein [Bryobacteraceae bacterium]
MLPPAAASAPARFAEHAIADDLKSGYQVVAVDVNHDGKTDLIALASGMAELVWFENPGWERHVIAGGLHQMINLGAWDTDGDGIPEIVLASEFSSQAKNSIGIVSVLEHNGDPRQPWKVREIDRLTTSHRLRWADIYGNGKKVLVNQPLTGASAEPPQYLGHTPLVFYKPGEWKREMIGDQNEGVVHGLYILDWDGDGRDDILTASFVGIALYHLGKDGRWTRTELAKGDPASWPQSGSSDIAEGKLGKQRFLCAIEPWHGNQVAVYRQHRKEWQRQVIDSSLVSGHTIITSDLNGDGRDEIIAGFRGKGQSVYLYYALDTQGTRWDRQALDAGGMAASACAGADLNGDGRPDIACIGATKLKWYENLGH